MTLGVEERRGIAELAADLRHSSARRT